MTDGDACMTTGTFLARGVSSLPKQTDGDKLISDRWGRTFYKGTSPSVTHHLANVKNFKNFGLYNVILLIYNRINKLFVLGHCYDI